MSDDQQFANELTHSPALQWALEQMGQEVFREVFAIASPIIRAGYSMIQLERSLPAEFTEADVFASKELNRCSVCGQKFYFSDRHKKAADHQEEYIALIQSKLPARVQSLWRVASVHAAICYRKS